MVAPTGPPIATEVTGVVGPLKTVLESLLYVVRSAADPLELFILTVPTSTLTFRTHPALSAMYMHAGEKGSGITFRILD